MNHTLPAYTLIDNEEELIKFEKSASESPWIGFDTEFIGERRFYTLLCLIQISTPEGYYIIDAIKIKDLSPVLRLLQNPDIVKITHAGENDYRLFYQQFKIVPLNVFDTQIAAGFIGYRYPLSYAKLVGNELKGKISKGFTVSDWEKRPMTQKQIKYALDDVIPLEGLYNKIKDKLVELNRLEWMEEEMKKYQNPDLFKFNPYKEAYSNSLINGLKHKEKLFLLRIYKWRVDLARERDHSKEMVMPSKYISFVLKNIKSGKAALMGHRRLPPDVVKKHWNTFDQLYQKDITPEEEQIMSSLPPTPVIKNREDATIDLLFDLLKFHCQKLKLSPALVLAGINIKRMKMDPSFFDENLAKGWRAKALGTGLLNWFQNQEQLDIQLDDEQCVIRIAP